MESALNILSKEIKADEKIKLLAEQENLLVKKSIPISTVKRYIKCKLLSWKFFQMEADAVDD